MKEHTGIADYYNIHFLALSIALDYPYWKP